MRFITEFEIMEHEKNKYRIQDRKKAYYEPRFTKKIIEAFGWQNPIKGDWRHYKLEIEAFPMDKWIEFKANILNISDLDSIQYKTLIDLISELESFGKPAADTITNQKLTNDGTK